MFSTHKNDAQIARTAAAYLGAKGIDSPANRRLFLQRLDGPKPRQQKTWGNVLWIPGVNWSESEARDLTRILIDWMKFCEERQNRNIRDEGDDLVFQRSTREEPRDRLADRGLSHTFEKGEKEIYLRTWNQVRNNLLAARADRSLRQAVEEGEKEIYLKTLNKTWNQVRNNLVSVGRRVGLNPRGSSRNWWNQGSKKWEKAWQKRFGQEGSNR
tara:strand:- start:176 stop:814 length:639 start_codon:yes stop_codon:yes gene_type:complete